MDPEGKTSDTTTPAKKPVQLVCTGDKALICVEYIINLFSLSSCHDLAKGFSVNVEPSHTVARTNILCRVRLTSGYRTDCTKLGKLETVIMC